MNVTGSPPSNDCAGVTSAYCRIIAAIMPEEFGRALNDALSDAGLTYDDFQRMVQETRH
jgi:hypothetical protein